MSAPLPAGHPFAGLTPPYQLVLADPPWQFKDKASAGKRGAAHKYPVMDIDAICALPVADLCAKDCLLACWWVGAMPEEAIRVVKAWGFTLKTMTGFTWGKRTKNGLQAFGMGHWTRQDAENCLIATRGKPKRASASVRQSMQEMLGRHSEKPAEAHRRLEALMGDVRRVELFARQRVKGWDCWGLDAPAEPEFEPVETVSIPVIPPEPLLWSMGVRLNHALGAQPEDLSDEDIERMRNSPDVSEAIMGQQWMTTDERRAYLTSMRQVHEEVVGRGFYRYPSTGATNG